MTNSIEKFPMPTPEKPGEKEKEKIINLIEKDKELRGQYFKIREQLEEGKVSPEERKELRKKIKEINEKNKPIIEKLNEESKNLYSEIMNIPVKKKKEWSDEQWNQKIEKNKKILQEAEKQLEEMKDINPNVKDYLKERIKQKRGELGIGKEKKEKEEKPPEKAKTPEEIIIEKARRGEKLSKKEREIWQQIKEKKILEELERDKILAEIMELRMKKQRGEAFSKEEAHRLELLKLKWDILQRTREEVKPEEKIEKEKSREELEKELNEKRSAYASAYTEYRKTFGRMKEKDLAVFELTIKPVREYLKPGDSERLKSEDEKERKEAEERRDNFLNKLREAGLTQKKAEAIYEAELKEAEYDEAKKELGKKLTAEGIQSAEIFQKLVLKECEILNQAKIETWPPKEKNLFKKGLEWWMRRGTATRLLISTGLVTGVVAVAGGFSAPAIAMFSGYRYLRGAGAVLAGKLASKGVDWALSKSIKAKEEAALSKLETEFSVEKLKEVEKEYEKILEETAGRRRKKLIIKAGVMAAAGAGTAIGLGILEQAWAAGVKVAPSEAPPEVPSTKPEVLTPEEIRARYPGIKYEQEVAKAKAKLEEAIQAEAAPEEIKPEILPIGERGPEGAIIDYFRDNPEIAVEKFGCPSELVKDGTIQDLDKFNEWLSKKAHLLWLEDTKEALAKPETLEQLKKLGYSPDFEGYTQMMHHIGKGRVELDLQTGKINLVEMEYLKTRIPPTPETPEIPPTPETPPLRPEEIALAEERIKELLLEVPPAKPTEEIFREAGPEITRHIITEKTHDIFGIWSGTYDKFSDIKLKNFFEFDNASGYRITGPPWEDYNYHEFSDLQKKMEKVYNALDLAEKSEVAEKSVEDFIKKYFIKIFEGK